MMNHKITKDFLDYSILYKNDRSSTSKTSLNSTRKPIGLTIHQSIIFLIRFSMNSVMFVYNLNPYQISVMYKNSILIDLKFHLKTHTHTYTFPKAQ